MTKNTVIDDAKSMASTLRSVRMMRSAEAIEKLIEAYLAQEARIAELDAHNTEIHNICSTEFGIAFSTDNKTVFIDGMGSLDIGDSAKYKLMEERIAELTKDAEPLSTTFIQTVPDKCDRIVWRGDYFHLPPKISHINFPTNSMEQEFANYERRGYEKGLATANTRPTAPKAITADMVTDEMVKTSVFVNVFNAKQQIANVVNAFNGVNP